MLRLKDGRKNLASIDFSPDGRFLAAVPSYASRGVKIFELSKPKQQPIMVKPPTVGNQRFSSCTRVHFTSESLLLVPTEIEGQWNIGAGTSVISWPDSKLVYRMPTSSISALDTYQLVNRRKSIVLPTREETIRWDFGSDPEWIEDIEAIHYRKYFQMSDDLNWYVVNYSDEFSLYQTSSHYVSIDLSDTPFHYSVFSPCSQFFSFVSLGHHIHTYHLESREKTGPMIESTLPISLMEITPDDRHLLAVCNHLVYVIDFQSGIEKARFDFKIGRILALKISDDGTMFAVSDEMGMIIVADIDF